jgi:hypothetical protein
MVFKAQNSVTLFRLKHVGRFKLKKTFFYYANLNRVCAAADPG